VEGDRADPGNNLFVQMKQIGSLEALALFTNKTAYEKDTSSKTGLRSRATVRASAQEEQSSEADLLNIEPGKDSVESSGVVQSAGLELPIGKELADPLNKAGLQPGLTSSGWSAHQPRTYL
jgi:hypothetical protein